jgi:hypothetical protein
LFVFNYSRKVKLILKQNQLTINRILRFPIQIIYKYFSHFQIKITLKIIFSEKIHSLFVLIKTSDIFILIYA